MKIPVPCHDQHPAWRACAFWGYWPSLQVHQRATHHPINNMASHNVTCMSYPHSKEQWFPSIWIDWQTCRINLVWWACDQKKLGVSLLCKPYRHKVYDDPTWVRLPLLRSFVVPTICSTGGPGLAGAVFVCRSIHTTQQKLQWVSWLIDPHLKGRWKMIKKTGIW